MDVFEALYTTRAMRRVRPDAIPIDAVVGDKRSAVRLGHAAHKPQRSPYFPT